MYTQELSTVRGTIKLQNTGIKSFDLLDKDKSGAITMDELGAAMRYRLLTTYTSSQDNGFLQLHSL